jgi:hypothetical protein
MQATSTVAAALAAMEWMDVGCGTRASRSECVLLCDFMGSECDVGGLCLFSMSDGGPSETLVEEYCSFVADSFVNQQYLNRLSDVAGVGSRRYTACVRLRSKPRQQKLPRSSRHWRSGSMLSMCLATVPNCQMAQRLRCGWVDVSVTRINLTASEAQPLVDVDVVGRAMIV